MRSSRCRKVLKVMIPYVSGELDTVDSRAVEAHIAECEQCSAKFVEMRQLMALLASDSVVSPDTDTWRRLSDEAFMKWRGESRQDAPGPKAPRAILRAAVLRFIITPAAKPALAGAFVLVIGMAVWLAGGNADTYSRSDFYIRHFAESPSAGILENTSEMPDGPVPDDFVMGFSYNTQPGSFVLGVEYARTYQACSFAFDRACKNRMQDMNRVLAGYPHADLDAVGYSADKAAQLASLRALHEDIKQDIAPLEAEYFLYQLGGWVQDMSLAVAKGVDTVAEERARAAEFARLARRFNLARGVVEALTEVEIVLSHRPTTTRDRETLQSMLADIYTILS